jgi:hypothetical protein
MAACAAAIVEMPFDLSEHGRGPALIQLMVDNLTYRHDGSQNVWQISRSRRNDVATGWAADDHLKRRARQDVKKRPQSASCRGLLLLARGQC